MVIKPDGSRSIQSVQRALNILNLFNSHSTELSLSEISSALELNKSTAYGLINTLLQNNYLGKNFVNGKYVLGRELLNKITTMQEQSNTKLIELANHHMRELVYEFKSTAMLFSYRSNSLVCLKILTPGSYDYYPIMDFHCSVSGRLVLSHWSLEEVKDYFRHTPMTYYTENTITDFDRLLDEIRITRDRGYAVEFGEIIPESSAVSAPIYDDQNRFIGTMSLSGDTDRFLKQHELIAQKLVAATKDVSSKF